ncbi:probable Replication factor C subunit 5 [Saccharomycodes ludwigii]|uniref:Probable Replication factor C subunit 5 n=1 Tax=Saccharomycodes ludwigii TaxID=36035 RepID=A0A376B210_9ASCO|nr:hypothetical protein SCDLUD_000774 [Saccharomycodes ludwigii]KAH3903160.1 hypothetical protein SCDLUD_000774 [Saccharomycodes ludwigii]SSD58693.1 probable Replication factor C subunit 5 [Saccharomycodes ludwigii]
MSLWVDKYRPSTLAELSHNEHVTNILKSLSENNPNDLPHLLLYGPNGSGKKTRTMCLLNSIFDSSVYRLKIDVRQFQVNSRKLELNVVSSPHHVEITPSDLGGSYDRVVIQELLKEIGQTEQVEFGSNISNTANNNSNSNKSPRFKVVIINDANSLSLDAQAALRRTMEKYSKNIRLFMLCDSLSSIISPIKSRVLLLRIPAPTNQEIVSILDSICFKQQVNIENKDNSCLLKIASFANGNLRLALLTLESMAMANNLTLKDTTSVIRPDWQVVLMKMSNKIIKERNVKCLIECRSMLYELLAHCIPADVILHDLTMFIISALANPTIIIGVVKNASIFDERLALGSKVIYHLEGFIANVMCEMEK